MRTLACDWPPPLHLSLWLVITHWQNGGLPVGLDSRFFARHWICMNVRRWVSLPSTIVATPTWGAIVRRPCVLFTFRCFENFKTCASLEHNKIIKSRKHLFGHPRTTINEQTTLRVSGNLIPRDPNRPRLHILRDRQRKLCSLYWHLAIY